MAQSFMVKANFVVDWEGDPITQEKLMDDLLDLVIAYVESHNSTMGGGFEAKEVTGWSEERLETEWYGKGVK